LTTHWRWPILTVVYCPFLCTLLQASTPQRVTETVLTVKVHAANLALKSGQPTAPHWIVDDGPPTINATNPDLRQALADYHAFPTPGCNAIVLEQGADGCNYTIPLQQQLIFTNTFQLTFFPGDLPQPPTNASATAVVILRAAYRNILPRVGQLCIVVTTEMDARDCATNDTRPNAHNTTLGEIASQHELGQLPDSLKSIRVQTFFTASDAE